MSIMTLPNSPSLPGFERLERALEGHMVLRGNLFEAHRETFLHIAIAAREFLRSFVLTEGIEVPSAALENGLLEIDLTRPKGESPVRTIEINSGGLG